jgi:hypothetical protein
MSFETLKLNELKQVAETFGIDLPEKANKQSVILARRRRIFFRLSKIQRC